VPYKRIDLAVEAYTRSNYPLKIVGTGTDYEALARQAGQNIEFLGWRSDEEIVDLYRRCRCLVFPGEEDFGIVPVEAQACGRPVVAFRRGGALETVRAGETGVFFEEASAEALSEAVNECAGRRWDPMAIRANAERFGIRQFLDGLDRCIRKCLA
jgi:glycosyltransferase involved in cell wall biosynthesis